MTHDLKALRELEKRLAEAKGPDSYIDCVLYTELGSASRGDPGYPNGPTASLDAAVALVERVLPGATWSVEGPKTPCATLYCEQCDDENHFATTPALALCLAAIRALISQGEQ